MSEQAKQVVVPLDLAAIKERATKASTGPWKFAQEDDENYAAITGPGEALNVVCFFEGGGAPSANDAEFMAHCRTDVPALVAEVERLQGLLNSQKTKVFYFDKYQEVLQDLDSMCDFDVDLFDVNSGFADAEALKEANDTIRELKSWMDEARLVLTPPKEPQEDTTDEPTGD